MGFNTRFCTSPVGVTLAVKMTVSIYYLELTDRRQFRGAGCRLEELGGEVHPVGRENWEFPQRMYREVGRPLQWTDRLSWSELQWQEYAANPSLSMFQLRVHGEPAGYFELEQTAATSGQTDVTSVQLVYFGLLPQFVGRRLGGPLLASAVEQAWQLGAARIWLHTCTLDHHHALSNYLTRGFTQYATRTVEKDINILPPDSLAAHSRSDPNLPI